MFLHVDIIMISSHDRLIHDGNRLSLHIPKLRSVTVELCAQRRSFADLPCKTYLFDFLFPSYRMLSARLVFTIQA